MKSIYFCLALALVCAMRPPCQNAQDLPEKGKPDPVRIKAMKDLSSVRIAVEAADRVWIQGVKAAVADIEKGALKIRIVPPPGAPWYDAYIAKAEQECGVEFVDVGGVGALHAEIDGYNAVMEMEIEYRFGKGVLVKLYEQAEEDWFKNLQEFPVGCGLPE